jgi:tripeptidyl-peptidase-1
MLCYAQTASCLGSSQRVEQLEVAPDGWLRGSRAQPTNLVKFHLAITQYNTAEFEQKVIEISTPSHPSYGQYMKRNEVKDFLRPPAAITDKIIAWLTSADVHGDAIDSNGNWISFTVPVSKAERILKTEFFYFHHPQQGTILRTLGYSVPDELHSHIQLIQPTTRFGQWGSQKGTMLQPVQAPPEQLSSGCDKAITPRCLRDLYGIDDTVNKQDRRNQLGISGYLEQYARYADLEEFLNRYAPNQTNANFSVVSINGGQDDQNSSSNSVEANLDVQYSIPLADEVLATFYTTGGRGPEVPEIGHSSPSNSNEPYLEQLHYLLGLSDEDLPAVLSNSYGEDEQSLPASYVNATCSLFAQLSARGVSVIFSSGDSGPGSACVVNDGTNRTRFLPGYPASCPFVTAVGGTHEMNPETAIYFSGGGFSEIFPRPSYQEKAVKGYLSHLGSKWKGLYNPDGRAYPDVSAQGSHFVVRDHGMWLSVAGTRFVFP